MIKIAILGKAGSGKSTIASIIAHDILKLKSDEYQVVAFADKIKQVIEILFPGCNKEYLYGGSELRQNPLISELNEFIDIKVSCRQVALDLGKLGRTYHPAFWVAHIARHFKHSQHTKFYILADVRFIEEIEWLKKNNFILCKVKRDNLIKINDISETEQEQLKDDQFDVVINNNESIDILKTHIRELFTPIFHKITSL